jgi:hypothetical protein
MVVVLLLSGTGLLATFASGTDEVTTPALDPGEVYKVTVKAEDGHLEDDRIKINFQIVNLSDDTILDFWIEAPNGKKYEYLQGISVGIIDYEVPFDGAWKLAWKNTHNQTIYVSYFLSVIEGTTQGGGGCMVGLVVAGLVAMAMLGAVVRRKY